MWQLELLAEASGNLVREWRGTGLALGAGMGCAVAFTCPCNRPKIHGDRTSVAYSNSRRALKSAQEHEDQRRHRNERDRARSAAETVEQRSKRLRKRREREHARCTAQTASERQVTSQQRSTRERERMPAETPEERERRLQRMSTNQQESLAVEAPRKEKEDIAHEHQPAQNVGS